MKLRITIADDHRIIRVGLRSILDDQPDMEVVGEADCAQGALELIQTERPDVAIVDLNLPDGSGLSILPQVRAVSPHTRVLILTMHSEPDVVRRSVASGIQGYMNKVADPDEVVRAVRSVGAGRSCLSVPLEGAGLSDFLRGSESDTSSEAPRASTSRPLSDREREVLELFARGFTHRQIADRLGVRVKTVETYRSRLGDKFGVRSRSELVRCARELGIFVEAPAP